MRLLPLGAVCLCSVHLVAIGQDRSLLDSDWRFELGDASQASAADFDDSSWRRIDLPHDWSIEHPTDPDAPSSGAGGYFKTGTGWYRKHFELPPQWRGRSVWVAFEGVYQRAQVWLNGTLVGQHAYGFTPFRVELTDGLRPGEENVLSVRVDHSAQPSARWYTGSGIYRHVWLESAPATHLRHDGVRVVVRTLTEGSATLNVSARVDNDSPDTASLTAEFQVFAPDGEPLGRSAERVEVGGKKSLLVERTFDVDQPRLWSPDHPALYRLETRLLSDEALSDRAETKFGIRTVRVDPARGLLLNDAPIKLYGGNVHHDHGPLGAKAFDRAEERRVELLKAAGFNAVRTAHNIPSVAFLDACDRLGMLVVDESFDGWAQPKYPHDYGEVFADNWRSDLAAKVRRDRNHPSVVLWSIGNEMYERGEPHAVDIARDMARLVRRHDASRPITAGVNGFGGEGWERLDPLFAQLDVAGYNYETHRFAEDRQRVPNRVMLSTESYPQDIASSWRAVHAQPYVVGDFVWSAIDYLGESGIGRVYPPGEQPRPHWEGSHFPWHGGTCGDIDITGHRKPVSHFRNIAWDRGEKLYAAVVAPAPGDGEWGLSQWATLPTVAGWTWPGREGREVDVEVFSRWPRVRLELNGKRVAEASSDNENDFRNLLKVQYQPGDLDVIGVDRDGKDRERQRLSTAGAPAQLRLTPDRRTLAADGQDLSFVWVEVCDARGEVCHGASDSIRYEVAGPAEIVGIGSGDLSSRASYVSNPRRAHQGRALVVVRSSHRPGTVSLKATAEGIDDETTTIQTEAPRPADQG